MKQTLALVSLAVTFVSQANAIAQWQQCAVWYRMDGIRNL